LITVKLSITSQKLNPSLLTIIAHNVLIHNQYSII